jgi:hypothetical protein
MLPEVRRYLDNVRSHLFLDPKTEKRVIGELYTYFQEKIEELQGHGLSQRQATREAIKSFGRARVVARLMYEAYSKGSWPEALLSALPHLIVAGLFISHLWYHPFLSPMVFAMLVGVTLLGWWHGKPNWMYPWIGYSYLPFLFGGYASFPVLKQTAAFLIRGQGSLPPIYILMLVFALLAFSLWIIIRTTVRVVRRDWILASLMLVPLPILGSWLFNIEQAGGLFHSSFAVLDQWDTAMAPVFTLLAAASAIFIRLRQRILKVAALVTLGVLAATIIGHTFWGELGFLGFVAAAFLSLLFLLSPALLEARIGHGEPGEGETWWSGDWLEHPSAAK